MNMEGGALRRPTNARGLPAPAQASQSSPLHFLLTSATEDVKPSGPKCDGRRSSATPNKRRFADFPPPPKARRARPSICTRQLSDKLEGTALRRQSRPPNRPSKKTLKKVLTLEKEIQYHWHSSKTDKGFLPGKFLCLLGTSNKKTTKRNTTGKEKEHIQCIH